MRLSVIVTSYRSPDVLEACLVSLAAQPEAGEIVVADGSPEDPTPRLRALFPSVRVVRFTEPTSVPRMRWTTLGETRGDVVAATEARCVPSPTWCRELLAAHEANGDVPAIGGPVAVAPGATAFELGLYFSEYGQHSPGAPAAGLSGANLSYKRAALERERDLLDAGAWETLLHERFRERGLRLVRCEATVTFHNTMTRGTALAQRFHYGRGYAADRVASTRAPLPVRLLRAASCPLLPVAFGARLARSARVAGLGAAFVKGLPWLLVLSTAWALGEAVGYLRGADPRPRIF